jgi:HSP20 family protein
MVMKRIIGVPIQRFRHQMDRLFDNFFGSAPWEESGLSATAGTWNPDLGIVENDQEIVIKAEMPGLGPEDIDVRVAGNILTLSGEKKEETEQKKGGYFHTERRFGSFFRSVELPLGTQPESITAEYDKGILTLKIARAELPEPKKIEVKPRKE